MGNNIKKNIPDLNPQETQEWIESIESLIKSWQKEIKKTNIIASTYDPGPIISKLRSSAFPGESIVGLIRLTHV